MRSLADFCRDFPADEVKHISHVYVGATRDALCEVVKQTNRASISHMVSELPVSRDTRDAIPLVVCHIHDEAYMKMRSSAKAEDGSALSAELGSPSLSRSRHSKVQNKFVTIVAGLNTIEFFTELQAMLRKDGSTIATALCNIISEVLELVAQGLKINANGAERVRVLHLVTGDGINTNENALKRMYYYVTKLLAGQPIRYFLLAWRCASHQANLVVLVAICGKLMDDPVENNPICANCVRLYKYLIPDYCEEFAASLRLHVVNCLELVADAPGNWKDDLRKHSNDMQALYGPDVFSPRHDAAVLPQLGHIQTHMPRGIQSCRKVFVGIQIAVQVVSGCGGQACRDKDVALQLVRLQVVGHAPCRATQ